MTTQIAVLGYGNVGTALTTAFLAAGHEVTIATNPENPDGLAAAQAASPSLARAAAAPIREAVSWADVAVVAVPFAVATALLESVADLLDGVTVIDATNPVGPGFTHALGATSGAERLAAAAPAARIVKCFNVYGAENLAGVPPTSDGGRPVMPYAGDDPAGREQVGALLDGLGWDGLDVGPLRAALDLEHLALLWIRMVRAGGHDGHLVWSARRWTP